MKQTKIIGQFNPDWVKTVTKEEFIKAQSHVGDDALLGEEYDKIVPPKKDDKK